MRPVLRHIANLWTLMSHPSKATEWTLEEKLQAIRDAGLDGVCWAPSPELTEGARRLGLIFVGGMAPRQKADITPAIEELKASGTMHVNVQLGVDEMLTPEALGLALTLMEQGAACGMVPAIESHRGTCTETPEKTYALADAYQETAGELMRISWDFSHFAVLKHLLPENFSEKLLVRPDLVQHAQQFHLRPFNGHHAQVAITYPNGELTQEVLDWIPFAGDLLRCWLEGNRDNGRELFICPELGPVEGGYALSTFPNSWEDAKVLRGVINELWQEAWS